MPRLRGLLVLLTLLPATGCLLGPSYARREIDTPATWTGPAAAGEVPAPAAGFALLGDPVLDELVRNAFARNLDLAAAWWRIEEARAQLGIASAATLPAIDYATGASRDDASDSSRPGVGTVESYSAAVGVSWEIDLFGRLRRSSEAARAELLATEAGRQALALTLAGDVASSYFTLLGLDDQLAIAERTLVSRQASLALIRSRFEGGIVSQLELHQAEIEEAAAAAAVPAIVRARARVENALRLLLAQPPGPVPRGEPLSLRGMPPVVPTGLPSELLERRPDVVAAEARLHAATATIGVAEALRWPSLSLTGALGVESRELADLTSGDAVFTSLAGSLFGPLLDFGRNKRRVEIARAQAEEAALAWQRTVLVAFRDVEEALVDLRTAREEQLARSRQAAAAVAAVRLSRARWDGGIATYLEVLDLERSQLSSELAQSGARGETWAASVRLLKALGGGWEIPAPVSPAP